MDNTTQKTGPHIPTFSHDEKAAIDIECLDHTRPNAPDEIKNNALTYHREVVKTPEEAGAERRFVRKIDFLLLPLLGVLYFLASLVSVLDM